MNEQISCTHISIIGFVSPAVNVFEVVEYNIEESRALVLVMLEVAVFIVALATLELVRCVEVESKWLGDVFPMLGVVLLPSALILRLLATLSILDVLCDVVEADREVE